MEKKNKKKQKKNTHTKNMKSRIFTRVCYEDDTNKSKFRKVQFQLSIDESGKVECASER